MLQEQPKKCDFRMKSCGTNPLNFFEILFKFYIMDLDNYKSKILPKNNLNLLI